jgi:hypothetical protein
MAHTYTYTLIHTRGDVRPTVFFSKSQKQSRIFYTKEDNMYTISLKKTSVGSSPLAIQSPLTKVFFSTISKYKRKI